MGVKLGIKTETFSAPEDQSWLGSAHGTDAMDPITLDGAIMDTVFPGGVAPSGIALGKVTATGKYGPYDSAAVDGRATAVYILFTTVDLKGSTDVAGADIGASGFWHGEVILAKAPAAVTGYTGLDSTAQTALKFIKFV